MNNYIFINNDKSNLDFSKIKLNDIWDHKIIFDYKYVSLQQGCICFDNPKINIKTYVSLIEKSKYFSSTTIKEILDKEHSSIKSKSIKHNHVLEINDKRYFIKHIFKSQIKQYINEDIGIPTFYQLEIFTDNINDLAPRIIGFFGEKGVFYLIWLDYEHKFYPRDNRCNDKWTHYYL